MSLGFGKAKMRPVRFKQQTLKGFLRCELLAGLSGKLLLIRLAYLS